MLVFVDLLESVSLAALALAVYAWAQPWMAARARLWSDGLLGLIFGLTAVASILSGMSPHDGIVLDGRTVMLTLAGLFGGPVGGLVAAALAGICRYLVGGAETVPALAAILAVTAVAVAIGVIARRHDGEVGYRTLFGAAAAAAAIRATALMLYAPSGIDADVLGKVVLSFSAAIFSGVLVTGVLMLRERRRVELEALLDGARRQAEHAQAEAEAANRAKSTYVTTLSHELRTPLNAVIGFAQLLEQETFGPHASPKYRQYAGLIGDSGRHLLGLIDDILDQAKLEAGKLVLDEAPCDPTALARAALAMISPRAEDFGVRLNLVAPDPGLQIRADALRVEQVLLNLLSNAVKFTPRGGQVTLSVGRGPGGEMRFGVADEGIGIAVDQLARLFQPFTQVAGVERRGDKGTGLGLAISRSLIEAHGGTLTLSSQPGRGTTATVTLPAARIVRDRAMPAAA